jgi:hypothetical protein
MLVGCLFGAAAISGVVTTVVSFGTLLHVALAVVAFVVLLVGSVACQDPKTSHA